MLLMREHTPGDYAALRDMDATDVGDLRDDDHHCLEELGRYLVDSDAWQRFSVWLLHKHFEPAEGEVFVERAIHAPRGTATGPVQRSATETPPTLQAPGTQGSRPLMRHGAGKEMYDQHAQDNKSQTKAGHYGSHGVARPVQAAHRQSDPRAWNARHAPGSQGQEPGQPPERHGAARRRP